MANPNTQHGLWSAEQIAAHDAKVRENFETTLRVLNELAGKYRYSPVSTMQELGLTPEQINKITYNDPAPNGPRPNRRFYTSERNDGQKVKLIAEPVGNGDVIAADFFSPGFYEGHGGNHDFSYKEMEGNMELALENNYGK